MAELSLPTGGGAIKGIGETFQADPFTGTASFAVPIVTSPGRSGFGPKLALQYSSGHGNGVFGLGWQLSIPRVTRKTEKGLPRYEDDDVFVVSGAEDLVPQFKPGTTEPEQSTRGTFMVDRYRARTEGQFARVERWTDTASGEVHWHVTTRDNITSIYGRTAQARIADPVAEAERAAGLTRRLRVYEWLLEETFDAKGNHVLYEYAADDPALLLDGPEEQHRTYGQRYLRRICYGNINAAIRYPDGQLVGVDREATDHDDPLRRSRRRYVFEVVFDYGGATGTSRPQPSAPEVFGSPSPPVREDAFSTYRAGFEIRTLRRCERVLMFHHFAELGGPALVRSTDFTYTADPYTRISFLSSVTARGYRQSGTEVRTGAMPPVTFQYSEFRPHEQRYQSLCAAGNDLPPSALSDPTFALVDLFGDGLPDVLDAGPAGFRYWKNLGGGLLDRPRFLPTMPAGVALGHPGVALADMDGDGRVELVVHTGPLQGFFRSTSEGAWDTFKPYPSLPSFAPNDPNVRLVDLTGDGRSDALMTREHHFLWFECLGDEGFAEPRSVERIHDLDAFPDIAFDDPSRRLHLADMNGDGLADIVVLHPGRVDYWPNLGYGRFGPRITMQALPDAPQLEPGFDPRRLFLADLDGTGCADLVYVEFDRVHFWFNRSGNSWSERHTIYGTPPVSDADAVQFADVFGTGTATLLWTSDFAFQPTGNYKALDFCGGVKPYVLVATDNNMGATTRVRYAPSTRFALDDARDGHPWLTKLPFPVQVVEKVETIDHVGRTKLVTTYRYHHGYFDGHEREFRGFGRVDRRDTEDFETFRRGDLHSADVGFDNVGAVHHLAPVLTRTWFHTGAEFSDGSLRERFRCEFFAGDAYAFDLGEPAIDATGAAREVARALAGRPLRTEVYAEDGSVRHAYPYTASEQRYRAMELQRPVAGQPGVHLVNLLESVAYQYEREPTDPRVTHQISLVIDAFGNITDAVSIAYPRRRPGPPRDVQGQILRDHQDRAIGVPSEQQALGCTYKSTQFINQSAGIDAHYVGVAFQTRSFEITGLSWTWPDASTFPTAPPPRLVEADFGSLLDLNEFIAYEATPASSGLTKRLIGWQRTYFRRDTEVDVLDPPGRTDHRLPLGEIGRLGLPYDGYQLALTEGLLQEVFGNRLTANLESEAGYQREADVASAWWIASGRTAFRPEAVYVSHRSQDPFGAESKIRHDRYHLLTESIVDALDNTVRVVNDYRVLQPARRVDANGNQTEVAFDALGFVVAAAQGPDSVADVEPDLDAAVVRAYLSNPTTQPLNSPAHPRRLIGSAGSRLVYDLSHYRDEGTPNVTSMIARETHGSPDAGPAELQVSLRYSDGFGREVQKKLQAEPGDVDGMHADHRWVGSGWTIFNNKAQPVQQFEPFFSTTDRFEFDVRRGVGPLLFYDPLGRTIATLHPDRTYEKVVFDAWQRATWDANDTTDVPGGLTDGWPGRDPDVDTIFRALDPTAISPTWRAARTAGQLGPAEQDAARKAAAHAGTPTLAYFDILGRVFLTVADAGQGHRFLERVQYDIKGNRLAVTDARGIKTLRQRVDLMDRALVTAGPDAGPRLALPDYAGKRMATRDARGQVVRIRYDELRREVEMWVAPDGGVPFLARKTVYGERLSPTASRNHRGRIFRIYDGAGVLTNVSYDFKGNVREWSRRLARDYRTDPRWDALRDLRDPDVIASAADSLLETEELRSSNEYDALNRLVRSTLPDGSVRRPLYNKANFLTSLSLELPGESARPFVTSAEYDARGQCVRMTYGNGVVTVHEYDALTFRLRHTTTRRAGGSPIQELTYTYDPVGNVVQVQDAAFPIVFNANQRVDPITRYSYDAVYRLTEARSREHEAMGPCHHRRGSDKQTEFIGLTGQPISDGQALRNYTETYTYDSTGNLKVIQHAAGPLGSWTRTQDYELVSNRLVGSNASCADEDQPIAHDADGNIIALPTLRRLTWDYGDRLRAVELSGSGAAYYVYDGGGNRIRAVVERNGRRLERVDAGGLERLRESDSAGLFDELIVVHLSDGSRRIALIERSQTTAKPQAFVRYQLGDHLGSVQAEVDDASVARFISIEEFYPCGGTAYLAGADRAEAFRKRHRWSGKERDDETGLYYFGARYYAPWLCRWLACDPAGMVDGCNGYVYARNNPIRLIDPNGASAWDTIVDTAVNVHRFNMDMTRDIAAIPVNLVKARVDDMVKTYDAAKRGEVVEAIGWYTGVNRMVETAAEHYTAYTDAGASGGEAAAIMVGDVIGTNDLIVGATGSLPVATDPETGIHDLTEKTLTVEERAVHVATGTAKLAGTVASAAQGASVVQGAMSRVVTARLPQGFAVYFEGQELRTATYAEEMQFRFSKFKKKELGLTESRTGRPTVETVGEEELVKIRISKDVKSTHHTHQKSGLAVFGVDDAEDLLLGLDPRNKAIQILKDDTVHIVTGLRDETVALLQKHGIQVPSNLGEVVTMRVTTGAARVAAAAGKWRLLPID